MAPGQNRTPQVKAPTIKFGIFGFLSSGSSRYAGNLFAAVPFSGGRPPPSSRLPIPQWPSRILLWMEKKHALGPSARFLVELTQLISTTA